MRYKNSPRWRLDRWSDAAAKAIFRRREHFSQPPADLLGNKRWSASESTRATFESERLGRDVACDSAAEREVFSWLERSPDVRWYQEQPTAVRYTFGGHRAHYYPDAAVLDREGRLVVVEVKPVFTMHRLDTVVKATAALHHFGPRGIGYLLVDARGHTLADLAAVPYDPETADTIESLFVHGPVSFRTVRSTMLLRGGRFERAAFMSMVVNRDWGVTSEPRTRVWKLQEGLSFRPLLY